MSGRASQFITEAFLSRWIEESERTRSDESAQRIPVTRLCHPLRGMLAINGSNQIVGVGTRLICSQNTRLPDNCR